MSDMSRDEAEAFTEALAQIHAGGWRLSMQAWRLGVPQALGLNHEQWVQDCLGGYVRLSIPERREAVAELAEEGLSQREIADVLGVGEATVSRDINVPNGTDQATDSAHKADINVPNGTEQESNDDQIDAPLLSVVDLETGEVVQTSDAEHDLATEAALADLPLATAHEIRKGLVGLEKIRRFIGRIPPDHMHRMVSEEQALVDALTDAEETAMDVAARCRSALGKGAGLRRIG